MKGAQNTIMGGFSQVPKKHYKNRKSSSRKSSGRSSSSDIAIIGIILFFSIAFAIGKMLLLALPIIIVIVIIYSWDLSVQHAEQAKVAEAERQRKEKEKKEKEKRQDLKWINEPEPSYDSRMIPSVYNYPKEELRVGNGYVEYLKEKDNVDRLNQHIEWIDKYNSICKRYSVPDAKDYSEERRKSTSELDLSKRRLNSLKYKSLFQPDDRTSGIKESYERIHNALNKAQREDYNFKNDVYGYFDKSCAMESEDYLFVNFYFTTPWYIIVVNNKYLPSLSLVKYINTKTDMWCDEEEVDFASYNDDVARVTWEHARKDGGPDLRYTNNKKTTYVYRGRVKISFDSDSDGDEATLSFSNKKDAQEFCDAWKEYSKLLKRRENSAIVNAVLNNTSKSLDDYFKKKERNRVRREKRKQKQEDYFDGLKPRMILTHKTLGKGELLDINDGYMTVELNGEKKMFKYPDAIKKGFFVIN